MSDINPSRNNLLTEPSHTCPDSSSDSEIESISSTCTFALNYKLPARYVYPKNQGMTELNTTTTTTNVSALPLPLPLPPSTFTSASLSTSVSESNSSKRTRDDMEGENDDDYGDDDGDDDDGDDDDDGGISDLEIEADYDYYDDYYDDDDDDSDYDASRKGETWWPEEDDIILHEREIDANGYAGRAAKRLDGRDAQSVHTRWNIYLKKKHDPNAPVRSCVKWTAEEDAIILHEREVDVNGYAGRAAKRLDGRDAVSVDTRWNRSKEET